MYILTDQNDNQVLGRFDSLTEARSTLLDFYRLHPPGGHWLAISTVEPKAAVLQVAQQTRS